MGAKVAVAPWSVPSEKYGPLDSRVHARVVKLKTAYPTKFLPGSREVSLVESPPKGKLGAVRAGIGAAFGALRVSRSNGGAGAGVSHGPVTILIPSGVTSPDVEASGPLFGDDGLIDHGYRGGKFGNLTDLDVLRGP
ncbi:hypothetical protein S40285_09934 [Stachybotrys chlorohalonatus IBT 40285]|uniref:Uncharacterized protein n=1 Tax=Stachybotrys chlorohalonatus (strain IBT 40285) TaxID=1283841 RepID=A0A084QHF9_STAC4|nr:hypothetical protein S40285_09934 [Stachybotrys chlorohalonata IBT 40285]